MLKRFILLMVPVFFFSYCDKESAKPADVVIGSKYAKYAISVKKDSDLKDWLATLEKAEKVSLLQEFETTSSKNKVLTVAKVQLADDKVGFIESRHLANDPIVFTGDTSAYSRPIAASTVSATVPKGSVGFVLEKKEGWTQVYVGNIEGVWVTDQWVEDNTYSFDSGLVISARDFDKALDLVGEGKTDEAAEILEPLASGDNFIAELASMKLAEINGEEEFMEDEFEDEFEDDSDLHAE